MKLVLFLICLSFAFAKSKTFGAIEDYGDVTYPCIGSASIRKEVESDQNALMSIIFPGVSFFKKINSKSIHYSWRRNIKLILLTSTFQVGPNKHLIKGFRHFHTNNGEKLPNIDVVEGGIENKFIEINISSKFPGQSIDSTFYFYGEISQEKPSKTWNRNRHNWAKKIEFLDKY